jgi:hypothetical protein
VGAEVQKEELASYISSGRHQQRRGGQARPGDSATPPPRRPGRARCPVRKDAQEHTETVRDTVRRTDVDVEQVGTAPPADAQEVEAATASFRRHHAATWLGSGTSYEDYEPAYHYGYDLGRNERTRGRDWAAVEAEARRDWEARRPGTWERFQDAIRYGWDKVRARA